MGGEPMEPVTIIDKRRRPSGLHQDVGEARQREAEALFARARELGSVIAAERAAMTTDRAVLSLAQEGVRLADMYPDQKRAVARWIRNEAGKLYWRAQGALATDVAEAESLLGIRNQFIARAEAIEADLAGASS